MNKKNEIADYQSLSKEKEKSAISRKLEKRHKETIQVDIRRSIYEMLEGAAKDRNISSIRQFVNYVLDTFLQKEKFTKEYFPDMELYAVGKSSLFVRYYDYEKLREGKRQLLGTTEVYYDTHISRIVCSADGSKGCGHIYFVLCQPEIYVLLNERGLSSSAATVTEDTEKERLRRNYLEGGRIQKLLATIRKEEEAKAKVNEEKAREQQQQQTDK